MIDHVSLQVSDLARSKRFYLAALAPLGYSIAKEDPGDHSIGFGCGELRDLWLTDESSYGRAHVAFRVASKALVDAFYAAAIAAGGTDHGAPGYRPHYHAGYYAAFVLDPDGHNIEVVFDDWKPTA